MEETTVLSSPELWPQYPYLRVERRKKARPGQATCFIRVDDHQHVAPTVYGTHDWPVPDDREEVPLVLTVGYESLEDLSANGWKPVLPSWVRLP